MAPKRLEAPEVGEEDFQRLSKAAKSSEVRDAFLAAAKWSRLGTKHLEYLRKNREALRRWARKGEL